MDPKLPATDAPNFGHDRRSISGLVFLLAFASLGCIGYGWFIAYKQAAMPGWPVTEATIIALEAEGEEHPWYRFPKVQFEYTVAGVRYTGTKLNPSPFNYQSKDHFENETGKLTAGAKVECWYNPSNPAESYVVNTGISGAAVILLVIGILILGLLVKALCAPAPKPAGNEEQNATPMARD